MIDDIVMRFQTGFLPVTLGHTTRSDALFVHAKYSGVVKGTFRDHRVTGSIFIKSELFAFW